MHTHDADRWCTQCGGKGLVSYANPGEPNVWETCPTCKGSQYEQWREKRLRELAERKQKEQAT